MDELIEKTIAELTETVWELKGFTSIDAVRPILRAAFAEVRRAVVKEVTQDMWELAAEAGKTDALAAILRCRPPAARVAE